MPAYRTLRIAARTELVSLILLLTNLFTVHAKAISALMGPAHGSAYLFVMGLTLRAAHADGRTKVLALAPGIGGVLALRRINSLSDAPGQARGASDPASLA